MSGRRRSSGGVRTTPRRSSLSRRRRPPGRVSSSVVHDLGGSENVAASFESDREVERLVGVVSSQEKVVQEQRIELSELQSRRDRLLYEIDAQEHRHQSDVSNLQQSLEQIVSSKKDMESRLGIVSEIEDRIIELYLEMSDRLREYKSDRERRIHLSHLQNEKITLKKQSALVVLDKLQHLVRKLLFWKSSFENELKNDANRQKTAAEEELGRVQEYMKELVIERDQFKISAARAIQEKNQAVHSRKVAIEEANAIMRRLQTDNERLIDEIKRGKDTIKTLNNKLSTREKILRHREIQLMKVTQLQSQLTQMKERHRNDTRRIRIQHQKLRDDYDSQMKQFNSLEGKKMQLEEELLQKNEILRSLRRDANRTKVAELEGSLTKHKKKLTQVRHTLETLQSRNEQLVTEVHKLKAENSRVRAEYQRIFNVHKAARARAQREEMLARRKKSQTQIQASDQKSTHVASFYKKALKEKEKEVQKLNARIRKMILSEQRSAIANRRKAQRGRQRNSTSVSTGSASGGPNARRLAERETVVQSLKSRNAHLIRKLREAENTRELLQSQSWLEGRM